jgi:hypothetical protein
VLAVIVIVVNLITGRRTIVCPPPGPPGRENHQRGLGRCPRAARGGREVHTGGGLICSLAAMADRAKLPPSPPEAPSPSSPPAAFLIRDFRQQRHHLLQHPRAGTGLRERLETPSEPAPGAARSITVAAPPRAASSRA